MIGYLTLGTNDLDRAGAFYDAVLAPLGAARAYTLDRMIAWAEAPDKPMLVVTRPADGATATPGNGTMVALICGHADQVQEMYALALSCGAEDAGPPAAHGDGFYGGYVRDPDGNKICVFVMDR
jgi:catechol 2,3-dioxygenase-like lactoylglutathione lyase family enzyme